MSIKQFVPSFCGEAYRSSTQNDIDIGQERWSDLTAETKTKELFLCARAVRPSWDLRATARLHKRFGRAGRILDGIDSRV
jgi:hypothetical protein